MVRSIYILIFLLTTFSSQAQSVDAFAVARANRTKVLVEQPIKVKVTVYTATWFLKPISFDNLQVEGAFVQTFSRTLSSIRYVNGKKYATLEFYYIIFPYRDGELIFPELTLTTTTPPENDYNGVEVTLNTESFTINVEPVPADIDENNWLVANSVSIKSRWSKDLNSLKVGDVLNRTITVRATGTLPSFIDGVEVKDIDFGNIYRSEPTFFDDRDRDQVKGRREDRYSYLLDRAGTYTVPEQEITWWNPVAARYYKRVLPPYELRIEENPALESLSSLRDSLEMLNFNQADISEEDELETQEVNEELYIYLLLALLSLYILVRLAISLVRRWRIRRERYRSSEEYLFDRVMGQKSEKETLVSIYRWIDHSESKSRSISTTIDNDLELEEDITTLKRGLFSSSREERVFKLSSFKKRLRRWYRLNRESKVSDSELDRLNPK